MAVIVHMDGTHVLIRIPPLGAEEGEFGWDKIEGNEIPPAEFPSETEAMEAIENMDGYHPPLGKLTFPPVPE